MATLTARRAESVRTGHEARRHRRRGLVSRPARRRRLTAAAYVAPMAAIVAVLFVVPLLLMVWMSITRWPLLGASGGHGIANYQALADPLFLRAIVFALKYTVITTTVLGLVSFGLALLVQEARPGVRLFRTVFFLPAAVGLASASLLFYGLFNSQASWLNALVRWLGLGDGRIDWLGDGDSALLSTVGMMTWRFAGYYMIILLTGLQSINPLLYEAARSDGANRLQIMGRITLPLLRPTIALMLVLLVTSSLLAFDQFFILTGGRHNTATPVIAIYREAFTAQDLGRASAVSVAVLVVLIVINVAQLRLLQRGEDR